MIEAADALDELGAHAGRERRVGADLFEAGTSEPLCISDVVVSHAAEDRPRGLDREEVS